MAQIDDRVLLPSERPATSAPDPALHLQVSPGAFGGYQAKGQQEFGQELFKAGEHWGAIAADDIANQFQEKANHVLHGDPNATVHNPDGTTGPDLGYLGLKGRTALDQRQSYEKRLENLFKESQGKLLSFDQRRNFNNLTRRYRAVISGQMGGHADKEANTYALQVNRAAIKVGAETIAADPNNEELFLHTTADMAHAAVKAAQVQFGAQPNDAIVQQAVSGAKAAAAETRILSIGSKDPVRALEMADQYKDVLGSHYHTVADHLRSRAEHQTGISVGTRVFNGGSVSANGDFDNNIGAIAHTNINYRGKGPAHEPAAGKRFETFASPEEGVAAAYGTMWAKARQNGGTITFSELMGGNTDRGGKVQGWAQTPATDAERANPMLKGNNASAYADRLAKSVGLKSGDQVPLNDDAKMEKILREMNMVEHNRQTVGDEMYGRGIKLARGDVSVSPTARAPGDRPSVKTQADGIMEIQNSNLPDAAKTTAIAQYNKLYAVRQQQEVRQKTAFNTRVADTVAETMETGSTTAQPITKDEFVQHFGDVDGPIKYQDYTADLQFAVDRKAMETMPAPEMQRLVDARTPDPASPGYAHSIKNRDRLQKASDVIRTTRREDPSGVVDRMPAVKEAMALYDPKSPETFRLVAQARMAAQERLEIEPEYRSPISKNQALELTKPIQLALPGQKMAALETVGTKYRQMFGDDADRAFLYSMRAIHVQGQAAIDAEGVLDSLSRGSPITEAERRQARDATQAAQIEASLRSNSEAKAGWMEGFDAPDAMTMTPPPGKMATPNGRAIRDLRDNPSTAGEFDKVYGSGTAKKLMDEYPGFFRGPAGGR